MLEAVLLSSWSHIIGPGLLAFWTPECTVNARRFSQSDIGLHRDGLQPNISKSTTLSSSLPNSVPKSWYKRDRKKSKNTHNDSSVNSLLNNLKLTFPNSNDCREESKEVDPQLLHCVGQILHGELQQVHPLPLQNDIFSRLLITPNNKIIHSTCFKQHQSAEEWWQDGTPVSLAVVFKNDKDLASLWPILTMTDVRMTKIVKLVKEKGPLIDHLDYIGDMLNDFYHTLLSLKPFIGPSDVNFCDEQTCGHTVVVGTSESSIKKMILHLKFLLNSQEKICSLITTSGKLCAYYSGLYVQGILKSAQDQSDLLNSKSRFTLIDVASDIVWQSCGLSSAHSSLQPVRGVGKFVPELMEEISLLTHDKAKQEHHLLGFRRHLHLKAMVVIKMVEKLRKESTYIQRIPWNTILGLEDPEDIQIVLSTAEKMKPGILNLISPHFPRKCS
ncbi:uncharacterized protein LOC106464832 isoform X2 [Limulus polyphemus]|uniref:Uncharacterized protein LOC106464832 isoform X2 n=1 Tax=Limulus polyphemus TaxID=6850 RepID=A0ABM1SXI6_LIMPO|nr:uncharacterized protein LOC106464832 isoform X2 [Limulus polyphemus]